jgi:hypothetical protein
VCVCVCVCVCGEEKGVGCLRGGGRRRRRDHSPLLFFSYIRLLLLCRRALRSRGGDGRRCQLVMLSSKIMQARGIRCVRDAEFTHERGVFFSKRNSVLDLGRAGYLVPAHL